MLFSQVFITDKFLQNSFLTYGSDVFRLTNYYTLILIHWSPILKTGSSAYMPEIVTIFFASLHREDKC